jgi:hypothetical protein
VWLDARAGRALAVRTALVSLLAAALLALAAAADAGAARKTCTGAVAFSGTRIVVVTLRGVTCAQAKRVVRAFDRGRPPRPWSCGLAKAPFDRIDGRVVGFSCGRGGTRGDLRRWPHAFVGTIAR